LVFSLLFLAFPWGSAWGAVGIALPRKVLVLYNKERIPGEYPDIAFTETHLFAEMPLNHLGFDLVYRNIDEDLPKLDSLQDFRGILTWFKGADEVPDPAEYCEWLDQALDRGMRAVVLGEPGVFGPKPDDRTKAPKSCQAVFRRLGMELGPIIKPESALLRVASKDERLLEFERRLDVRDFQEFRAGRAADGGRSHLGLSSRVDDTLRADLVTSGPRGAAALDPALLFSMKMPRSRKKRTRMKVHEHTYTSQNEQFRWLIDPFRFFETAFAVEGWPRPDATTLNGRRIFYTNVDGDGFFNVSEKDRKSWSAQIYLREFLEAYPAVPFSVSLVTGYYELPRFGTAKSLALSRKILNMPNVEAASHGRAHPMIWNEGEVGLSVPGYAYSPAEEIGHSMRFINEKLLSGGKKAVLFQWTGDCLPDERALSYIEKNGWLNINGGDARLDRRFNSVAFVTPLSRPLGELRQIYSSHSNENTYTDLWQGPYYGFQEVIETFERTDSPRRLKPVNVYMHFYSAEKLASIAALHKVFRWASDRPMLRMFPSEYSRIVSDFFKMRMRRTGKGRFLFEGGPRARTVRFDSEERSPDMKRSKGVLGFTRHEGSLYVALDGSSRRELVLTSAPTEGAYLIDADFQITDWKRSPGRIRFQKRGWDRGRLRLGGVPPQKSFHVREGARHMQVKSRLDGTLDIRFQHAEGAGKPTFVSVEGLP